MVLLALLINLTKLFQAFVSPAFSLFIKIIFICLLGMERGCSLEPLPWKGMQAAMIIHETPSVMTRHYTRKTKAASGLNASRI